MNLLPGYRTDVDRLHAMTFLLELGPDALIVAPEQLRRDLVEHLGRTQRSYAEAGGRDA